MKKSIWVPLLLLSLAVNIGLVYKFILSGNTTEITDQRTAILLEEGERELVLEEMRMFLSATQQITAGINAKDMELVTKAARGVGRAAAQAVPATLMGKLPAEFKTLGFSTHGGFDQLAMDAETMGDPGQALEQLSGILNNCVACHAAYQIRPTAVPQ